MPAVYEQYTEELRNKFGYLATWIPNTQLRLGDIGILKRDRFEYYSNLNELGIPFSIRNSNEASDFEYSSKGSVEINFKAAGNAPALGQVLTTDDAGISVIFNRENAIMFIGHNCRTDYIENLEKLGSAILDRYKGGKWNKDYVIITELVNAGTTTIIISNSTNARADFRVDRNSKEMSLSIADISGNVSITNSSGIDTKIIAAGQLTPLFRASGLRRRFLKGIGFETRSGQNLSNEQLNKLDKESVIFSDVEYKDFEN
jgi:hypothetical protein